MRKLSDTMFIIVVAALSAGCGSDDTGTSGDAQADTAGLDDVISVGDTAVLFDTTADITDDADSSTASDAFGPEVIQPVRRPLYRESRLFLGLLRDL